MLKLAMEYPEYRESAKAVQLIETTSGDYYGKGYQDVQHRMPKIQNTFEDLGWTPKVNMADALRHIYDAYRGQIAEAKGLVD
jgi:nucleoside-diphosphate-sugar epimerase